MITYTRFAASFVVSTETCWPAAASLAYTGLRWGKATASSPASYPNLLSARRPKISSLPPAAAELAP